VTAPLTIICLAADQTGIDGNGAITGDRVLDLFNSGTSLSLFGVAVHGGKPTEGGGGIRAAPGTTLNLTGSTVSSNTAAGSGGGIDATVQLTVSTVSGNAAGTEGGGINGDGTLTASSVRRNGSGGNGGGIDTPGGDLTITRSTIAGNDTTG